MTCIVKITRTYHRHYRDTGQKTTYVEWIDTKGQTGRTEGHHNDAHIRALLARGRREGVPHTREVWG